MPYAELQNGKTARIFLVSTTADEDAEEFVVSKVGLSPARILSLGRPAGMMNCELRADECWLNATE